MPPSTLRDVAYKGWIRAARQCPCALPVRARPPAAEAQRFFSVLESMDNGKADPRVARYRHPAGGAALLSPRWLGRPARQRIPRLHLRGRVRTDHPVELSALDAGVEGRTGSRAATRWCSNPRRHTADGIGLCRSLRRSRAAAGRGQHRHRRWQHGGALIVNTDIDKIAFTGSTEVGRIIRQATAGGGKLARAGWQIALHRL